MVEIHVWVYYSLSLKRFDVSYGCAKEHGLAVYTLI